MDATCNVQDSIHVFHLVHNMCLGFWVHINILAEDFLIHLKIVRNFLKQVHGQKRIFSRI